MVEWELFFKYFNAAKISTQNLNMSALHIFISGSYGDVFPNLALLHNVRKYHSNEVIVLIDEKWASLSYRFAQDGISFVSIGNEQAFKNSLMSEGRQYFLMPGWIYPVLPTLHPFLSDLQLDGYITDFEMKRAILRLPKEAKFELPEITNKRYLEIKKSLESAGCDLGNTCILSFENNSNPTISQNIIIELANMLIQKGITVALNVASTFNNKKWVPEALRNLPKISIPSDYPNEFVSLAGGHIGGLNGLSLILANFKTKAKIAVVADCTNPTITINGRQIKSEWWLNLSKVSPQDIYHGNNLCELNYKESQSSDFYSNARKWVDAFGQN
jgi:hypothetical protein